MWADLEAHEGLQVPHAERAHGAQADELLVCLVHGHVHDGEHVTDEASDGSSNMNTVLYNDIYSCTSIKYEFRI